MKRRVNERRSEKGLKKLGSGTRGLAKRLFGIPWLVGWTGCLEICTVSRRYRVWLGAPSRASRRGRVTATDRGRRTKKRSGARVRERRGGESGREWRW